MRHFLLASIRIVGISIGAVVGACATSPVVRTPAQAIAIGTKACDDSWGKLARDNGEPAVMNPAGWNARRAGDFWKVWYGSDERQTGMYIYVQRNGLPPEPDRDCKAIF